MRSLYKECSVISCPIGEVPPLPVIDGLIAVAACEGTLRLHQIRIEVVVAEVLVALAVGSAGRVVLSVSALWTLEGAGWAASTRTGRGEGEEQEEKEGKVRWIGFETTHLKRKCGISK